MKDCENENKDKCNFYILTLHYVHFFRDNYQRRLKKKDTQIFKKVRRYEQQQNIFGYCLAVFQKINHIISVKRPRK